MIGLVGAHHGNSGEEYPEAQATRQGARQHGTRPLVLGFSTRQTPEYADKDGFADTVLLKFEVRACAENNLTFDDGCFCIRVTITVEISRK